MINTRRGPLLTSRTCVVDRVTFATLMNVRLPAISLPGGERRAKSGKRRTLGELFDNKVPKGGLFTYEVKRC